MRVLLLALFALSLWAMDPVVSPKWLHEHLSQVKIIDVSEPKVYKKGHIPGALNAPIGLWREHHGNYLLIKKPQNIQNLLQSLGIKKDDTIVIYAHHTGKDLLKTSYVAWALELHGIKNTALLDGGYKAYKASYPTTKEVPHVTPSTIKVSLDPSIVIDEKGVRERIGITRILDVRVAIYYFGTKKQKVLLCAEHIPTATSYFWRYSFNENGAFKSKEALKQMLIEGLGLDPKQEVITYCTGGLETSMNWFVLHRILGFQKARLYDASMKQWANDPRMPLRRYRWE